MKRTLKTLAILGLLVVTVLSGCSEPNSVNADIPSGFELISEDKVKRGVVYKARDYSTGCYYIFGTSSNDSRTTVSIEQMMIEKDGAEVPYCNE